MDAETVNNLGGACQIVGVLLVVSDLLPVTRYRLAITKTAARLRARMARMWARMASVWAWVRRLFGRPSPAVSVEARAGVAEATARAHGAAVGMRGPFTPQPGQSLQEQITELGLLVNRLRDEVIREPQERKRAISEERQARQRELRAEAARLDAAADALRQELKELREVTTGGVRLRWEGVPVLLLGVAFTTWPAGIAALWPGWLPWRVVVLLAAFYAAARLSGTLAALTAGR